MTLLISRRMATSVGEVTNVYPMGRDSSMMPGPCFATNARYEGSMSGGPAFNDDGHLVGIVSSCSKGDDVEPDDCCSNSPSAACCTTYAARTESRSSRRRMGSLVCAFGDPDYIGAARPSGRLSPRLAPLPDLRDGSTERRELPEPELGSLGRGRRVARPAPAAHASCRMRRRRVSSSARRSWSFTRMDEAMLLPRGA